MTRSARLGPAAQAAEIDRVLTALGRRMVTVSGGAAVAAVAQAAVHHVAGTRWASVSVLARGRSRTLVATAPAAADADALQRDLGQGPLVDPAPDGAVQLVGDLARDRRWPDFSAQAAQRLGLAGLVVYQLPLPEEPGATVRLSMYSDTPDAFDAPALWAGSLLASHAAQAVAAGHRRQQEQHRDQALAAAREIGTAAGVLMARHGLDREGALQMLRRAAQETERSVGAVAAEVIAAEARRLPPVPRGPSCTSPAP